jgi:hypothetical protein
MRGVLDVAAAADASTAMALTFSGRCPVPSPGTSAATPLWAAVIALADQDAGQHLGFVNPAIYAIARSPAYHRAFHDVTTGDNSVFWPTRLFAGYQAGPGWDAVTPAGEAPTRRSSSLSWRASGLERDVVCPRMDVVSASLLMLYLISKVVRESLAVMRGGR